MVFSLVHRNDNWAFNVLYQFAGNADGAYPQAALSIGDDGSLYGTTRGGGGGPCGYDGGCGTVFKLHPPVSVTCRSTYCPWKETLLYRFLAAGDGAEPTTSVVFDQAGNLYGTLSDTYPINRNGKVYSLTPSGNSWTFNTVYSFGGLPDGHYPDGGVIFDNAENLVGTTTAGGIDNAGTAYQLTHSQSGWSEQVLHNFTYNEDGANPFAGLVMDSSGALYGGAGSGGAGAGTVFSLGEPPFGAYGVLYEVNYNNCGGDGGGISAVNSVAVDSSGNVYATTTCGGAWGYGSVFKLTRVAGLWSYTELYDFDGQSHGGYPTGLIVDSHGNLYGTASGGGDYDLCPQGCGVVWEITQ